MVTCAISTGTWGSTDSTICAATGARGVTLSTAGVTAIGTAGPATGASSCTGMIRANATTLIEHYNHTCQTGSTSNTLTVTLSQSFILALI